MDFGKILPCEYITSNVESADSLEVKPVGHRRMGLESLESHRLKRPSCMDFAKYRQCRATF